MPVLSPRLTGWLCAVAAPLCWSIGGVVFRSVEADPWSIVFWRSLGHVIAFPPIFIAWLGFAALGDITRAKAPAVVAALAIAASFVFHVMAMMSTTVANVLVLQSTSPFLVAILGWIVLGERVNLRGWVTIALAFAGLAPVIGTSLGGGKFSGDVFALAVALCSACMVILVRRSRAFNMQPVSWVAAAIAALIAWPLGHPFAIASGDIALLLMLGLVQTTLGLTFFLNALRHLPAAQVALIALLEPVLGPLWTWIFAGEEPATLTVIGGAVVIGALAFNTVTSLNAARRPAPQSA